MFGEHHQTSTIKRRKAKTISETPQKMKLTKTFVIQRNVVHNKRQGVSSSQIQHRE